ncbi:hypothetical protein KR018_010014, partial [Drosophila ironensis]
LQEKPVETLLQQVLQLLLISAAFMLVPIGTFVLFQFLFSAPFLGMETGNAAIGSGVATVIVMHVLLAGYTLRLIFQQEFSRMETLEMWAEWVPPQAQNSGPLLIIILLLTYFILIIAFPITTFFALKFVVLKGYDQMEAGIISAVGTVISVHTAVGFFIYRATYGKNSTPAKGIKETN